MCEIVKGQRRTFRDQDPPRICKRSNDNLKSDLEFSKSTPNSPTILQRASSLEKCFSEPEFLEKDRQNWKKEKGKLATQESTSCDSVRGSDDSVKAPETIEQPGFSNRTNSENLLKELSDKVPSSGRHNHEVITNGLKSETDSCDGLTNGRKMAPVLGVPPPPPPAPHMGPDGLILPRKPCNPYLTSSNHKDLRRELLFNQKVGKNVLNQKSELQRALEKQREAASRRAAEKNREENYKDDPRTALQRAIEQRAKNIEMALEQSQPTTTMEPPSNLLITARAKLKPRTDSQ
ncbi:PREDICTED: uncharacterized protein LOC108579339 isoform X1 [Habropoda laboriosa]|uniref:uncharacterized protein LOC108579339 isoform X1 n=1 Tax=Habropoda laboriosa TaxID=597456 RepID=UPI00083DD503|nr:PREDICTED: uncharacterized protein LOC108579339 isoform X1 [Habropoda laboriosa]XP_017798345.1 PREDICTED: uncharacterized protein LOC108579339 isoform X1 [Habropoda laboriosa]